MNVLLRAEIEDFERVITRRRLDAIAPVLICGLIATAIIVIEYRLMIIAFVMITPAIVAVIDAVMVGKSARKLGACEVHLDGDSLVFNPSTRVSLASVCLVRSQPDVAVIVERLPTGKFWGHLVAGNRAAQLPLLAALRGRGCQVQEEERPIAALGVFLFGVMANLILGKVAGVLLLGAIGFTIKGFVDGPGPGWEAGALFGGAVLCLTVKAVLHELIKRAAAQGTPRA